MRCGCVKCGAFMVHAEGKEACVCPECGHRCSACLGTDTVVSREGLRGLGFVDWVRRDIEAARESLEGKTEEE